jgi:hypothetical protein
MPSHSVLGPLGSAWARHAQHHSKTTPRLPVRSPKLILKFKKPLLDDLHRRCFKLRDAHFNSRYRRATTGADLSELILHSKL